MVIWLIPTIGLLVNSFRPAADVTDSRLVDGALPAEPAHARQLRRTSCSRATSPRVHQQPVHHDPGDGHPGPRRGVRGVRVRWMSFPGRNILFVIVVGLLVVPLQTTLIPVLQLLRPEGLRASPARSWRSGWPTPATACRSRSSCSATSWAACPGRSSSRPPSTARARSTAFFRLALPMSVPAHRGPGDLPVPVRLERPARRARLPRAGARQNLPMTVGHRQPGHVVRRRLGVPGRGRVHLDGRCRSSCSSALQRYFVRGITGGAVKG